MDSAANVVLHIGLHKTGTRYLQRLVLRQLDPARFNVDPLELIRPLRRAVRHPGDAAAAGELEKAVGRWRRSGDRRTLVLSEPHICGDMFSGYHDYAENLQLMHQLFPEARIMYVVRKQAGWLHSAYRQHLARGKPVPIETFLNFFDGRFHPRPARKVNGVRNMEALTLPFLAIYRAYAEASGPGRVYLLRHEDLKRSPDAFERRLAECLGIERLPDAPTQRSQNRSYSALAIGLFHPSTLRRPRPLVSGSTRPEGRRLPSRLTGPLRRLRRGFIQHVFDRLIYVDWDLLERGGMREQVERHYAAENAEIERIGRLILERGPGAVQLDQSDEPRDEVTGS